MQRRREKADKRVLINIFGRSYNKYLQKNYKKNANGITSNLDITSSLFGTIQKMNKIGKIVFK